MKYVLIDLERTIGSGLVYYWKQNRHGYTRDLYDAGLFDEIQSSEIIENDFDNRTIRVSEKVVNKIMD